MKAEEILENTRKNINHFKIIKGSMKPLPAIQILPKPDEGQGDENLDFIGGVMMKKTVKNN